MARAPQTYPRIYHKDFWESLSGLLFPRCGRNGNGEIIFLNVHLGHRGKGDTTVGGPPQAWAPQSHQDAPTHAAEKALGLLYFIFRKSFTRQTPSRISSLFSSSDKFPLGIYRERRSDRSPTPANLGAAESPGCPLVAAEWQRPSRREHR